MTLLERIRGLVVTTAAHFHHLDASFDVTAVSVIDQVRQRDELMLQCFSRSDAPLLIHSKHPLQQVDELPPVYFLSQ